MRSGGVRIARLSRGTIVPCGGSISASFTIVAVVLHHQPITRIVIVQFDTAYMEWHLPSGSNHSDVA